MALPVGVALGVLYDQMPQRMATVPVPPQVRPPKFDGKLARKGGYCWMSEMDLNSLRYWHNKKSQGGNTQYAEKDAKTTRELEFWIAWRVAEPTTPWRGERNRQPAKALPPSRDPEIHPWEPRGNAPAQDTSDADYFGSGNNDTGSNDYGF